MTFVDDYFNARRQQAQGNIIAANDTSPDDAAQAVNLESTSGVPSTVSVSDVKSYTQSDQLASKLALVEQDPWLQKYVNGHPMAAAVSGDDYHNLIDLKQQFQRLWPIRSTPDYSVSPRAPGEFFSAFKEGYGAPADEITEDQKKLYSYVDSPIWRGFVKYGLGDETIAAIVKAEHVFSGLTDAAAGYVHGTLIDHGMSEVDANRLTRDLYPAIQIGAQLGFPEADVATLFHPETLAAVRSLGPYAAAGQKPPVGIHVVLRDEAKAKAQVEAEALKKVEGAYDKTETARRSPTMGGQALDTLGPQEIGVSAEGIRKIYGDEVPAAGDGRLGDVVPDLAQRMEAVEDVNGTIKIPLKDWLQKVDPEVRDELRDHLRVREDSISKEEAKDLPKVEGEPEAEDPTHQALKEAGGFETIGEKAIGKPTTKAVQLELPEMTRMEDREVFDGGKFGQIGKGRMERYVKGMDEERQEGIDKRQARVERETKRQQTGEWKVNWGAMREQADADIRARPDVQALLSLDAEEFKIDPGSTSEKVPGDYQSATGAHADHVASWFGYGTGDEMMRAVNQLRNVRSTEGLTQKTFLKRMADKLTDKRMAEKYGNLAENIIRDAHDRLYSESSLDRLHEDTIHLAEQTGQQLPIKWPDLKSTIRAKAEDRPINALNPNRLLTESGRLTRQLEDELVKGNLTDAFKLAQRREIVQVTGAVAKDYSRLRQSFDRFTKTYAQAGEAMRKGMEHEYWDALGEVFRRLNIRTNRDSGAGALGLQQTGFGDLNGFFAHKIEEEWKNWSVPDFLVSGAVRPLDDLTLKEFKAVNSLLRQMVKDGKEEKTFYDRGQARRVDEIKGELKDQLIKHPFKSDGPATGLGQTVSQIFHTYLLQFPTLLKRVDNFRSGPWTRYVMRPLSEGGSDLTLTARQFQKDVQEMPNLSNSWLNKKVPNALLRDPRSGRLIDVRNSNLVELARYLGSPSSWEKAWKGWGLPNGDLLKVMLEQHLTPEAWDWVQRTGKMNAKADSMLRAKLAEKGEVPYDPIQMPPVEIKGQMVDGWYNRIHYHPQFQERIKDKTADDYMGRRWVSPTAPPGFYKGRTGYFAPVDMDLGHFATDMNERIRDMALRPALKEVVKVLDNDMKSVFRDHMGAAAHDMIKPYLEAYGNGFKPASVGEATLNRVAETFRRRMVGNIAGLNFDILSKHAPTATINSMLKVGPLEFMRSSIMLNADRFTGHKNWQFILDSSKEMRARSEHTINSVTGETEDTLGKGMGLVERTITNIGQKPFNWVDFGVSAATWDAAYRRAIRTEDHAEAVARADEAVRETHATSNIAYLPGIAREKSPFTRTAVVFYNFMNTMMQQDYKAATMAKDLFGGRLPAKEAIPGIAMALLIGNVIPSIIGQMAEKSPTPKEQKDWFTHRLFGWGPSVRGSAAETAGMAPVLGPMVKYTMNHGGIGGLVEAGARIPKELSQGWGKNDPVHTGDRIKDFVELAAILKGWGSETIGNLAKYLYAYHHGAEPAPSNLKEIGRIGARGTVHKEGPWEWLPGRAAYVKNR